MTDESSSDWVATAVGLLGLLVSIALFIMGSFWNRSSDVGFVTTNRIAVSSRGYSPLNVQIKRGEAVTFEVIDPPGSGSVYGVENIKGSSEMYASNVLRPGDKFNLIFERAGTFKFQDRYNRSIVGTVRVVE